MISECNELQILKLHSVRESVSFTTILQFEKRVLFNLKLNSTHITYDSWYLLVSLQMVDHNFIQLSLTLLRVRHSS